jgi:hypothetical protein
MGLISLFCREFNHPALLSPVRVRPNTPPYLLVLNTSLVFETFLQTSTTRNLQRSSCVTIPALSALQQIQLSKNDPKQLTCVFTGSATASAKANSLSPTSNRLIASRTILRKTWTPSRINSSCNSWPQTTQNCSRGCVKLTNCR